MSVMPKLSLYLLALLATFAVMFVVGRVFVPDTTVEAWNQKIEKQEASHDQETGMSGHSSDEGDDR